jgi:two-component system alkaline phosphatase synthesis response regulator PhoP
MTSLVYVIDDDTVARTAYAAALHKLGYQVETGSDGLEAQQLVAKARPALILLDMLMPNLDGIGFLKEFRRDEANAAVKVVVVSNFESMPEAAELGVSKYLSKVTHTPEAVAASVDEVLKVHT